MGITFTLVCKGVKLEQGNLGLTHRIWDEQGEKEKLASLIWTRERWHITYKHKL